MNMEAPDGFALTYFATKGYEFDTIRAMLILALELIMDIGIGLEGADFYIQRNGLESTVGTPTMAYHKDYFGVICNPEVLVLQYAYYVVLPLHQSGKFGAYASGSLALKRIKISTINLLILNALIGASKNK